MTTLHSCRPMHFCCTWNELHQWLSDLFTRQSLCHCICAYFWRARSRPV